MQFYLEEDIVDFFDVSIIMSFYQKIDDFRRVIPKNKSFFQRNGIEVIILLDETSEEEALLALLDEYSCINWKVVVNRSAHDWRNHCKVINVGIRHAVNKYVLILDPEVELYSDIIYQYRYILKYHPNSFAVGKVIFADFCTSIHEGNLWQFQQMTYGSIMAERLMFEEIGGYAETYEFWGGEDDNIRTRLELAGKKRLTVSQALVIHREDHSDGHISRNKKFDQIPIGDLRDIFYPVRVFLNNDNWGRDFNEICFDWRINKSPVSRATLLNNLEEYWVPSPDIFDNYLPVICLLQVRNEGTQIEEALKHFDRHCDGLILLDDGSVDMTYERSVSEKLKLKVRKRYKGYFDDLENRNLLLRLAHLFKCEWLFFIDADERFDMRYSNPLMIQKPESVDVIGFRLVHLWDNEQQYRIDIPECDETGILYRYRMFRNKGFMQINANRDLHFPAVPFRRNIYSADILVRHYGLMEKETRQRKYNNYILQDSDGRKQGYGYRYLMDADIKLANVDDIFRLSINKH